ncbi:MAG: agmatinase [Proteobacteria bacterium]|nr:agmatinase [Pseudomonadota bacterium]MBU1648608.1 agmatinase [Pseudomonadota bacterium]
MTETLLHPPKCLYRTARPASKPQPHSLNMIGFGFDGTACFRKGTAIAPDAIRLVASDIESYSPYLDLDLEETAPFYDLGNLIVQQSGDAHKDYLAAHERFLELAGDLDFAEAGIKFLTLGGEHSISYSFVARYLQSFPDLVLLHLDAHADLRDEYQGYHYSHASIIRRCLDHFGPGHQLLQFGIRSGTKDEYVWMRENHTLAPSLDAFVAFIEGLPASRPIYLTLDLDYFDPAFLPGTGTPEPGGQDFFSFVRIIQALRHKNMVAADVVELSPPVDASGNSDVFATKVVRELILAFHREGDNER